MKTIKKKLYLKKQNYHFIKIKCGKHTKNISNFINVKYSQFNIKISNTWFVEKVNT